MGVGTIVVDGCRPGSKPETPKDLAMFHQTSGPALHGCVQAPIRIGGEQGHIRRFPLGPLFEWGAGLEVFLARPLPGVRRSPCRNCAEPTPS
jgi:hypothetical protein